MTTEVLMTPEELQALERVLELANERVEDSENQRRVFGQSWEEHNASQVATDNAIGTVARLLKRAEGRS